MINMSKLLVACLIFTILSVYSVIAQDEAALSISKKVVTIATEEYPPFTSKLLKQNGICGNIITEAFRTEGFEVVYQYYPAARSYMLAQYGHVDATAPWSLRDGREKDFIYSEPVIVADSEHFYFLKELKLKWDPVKHNYNSLKGFKIGAVKSYNYGKKFQDAEKSGIISVERVSTLEKNFRKLLQGHIELVISHDRVGMHVLQAKFSKKEADLIDHQPQNSNPEEYYYLLFSRKKTTNKKLVETFNKGLQRLKVSGIYSQLLKDLDDGNYFKVNAIQ